MHRRAGKPIRKSDSGVTDVVGSMMLVAITVIIFAGLGLVVSQTLQPEQNVFADVTAVLDDGAITLAHKGGQALTASETSLIITIGGTSCTYTGQSGTHALFTASQFGGIDHNFTMKAGDTLSITPASPCPSIGTNSVAVEIISATGTGTKMLYASAISKPGNTCGADVEPPYVASWSQTPADITGQWDDYMVVRATLTDACSGANPDAAPDFHYRITSDPAAGAPAYINAGAMVSVGYNVWEGTIAISNWSAEQGQYVQYYLAGMKDNSLPPNEASSIVQLDPIQGGDVGYSYPATCVVLNGTMEPASMPPTCPAQTATIATCPTFTAGANRLHPDDCNDEVALNESAAVTPMTITGITAVKVTGDFAGGVHCPATDTSTAATGSADGLYACYVKKDDKLLVKDFGSGTGDIQRVELAFTGHYEAEAGYTPQPANEKVKLRYQAEGGGLEGGVEYLLSPTDASIYRDVTTDRVWTWAKVATIGIQSEAKTSNDKLHIQLDSLWVRITASVGGSVVVTNLYATAVLEADNEVQQSYHAQLAPDDLYAKIADKDKKFTVGGIQASSGSISKVELIYEGKCVGTPAKPCDSESKVKFSYKVGGFNGGTITYTQTTTDSQFIRDVTSARVWTWDDIEKISLKAQASTQSDERQTYVDAMWVRVTATGSGQVLLAEFSDFTPDGALPPSPIQNVLQVRYRLLDQSDTFEIEVCQDSGSPCGSWLPRGAELTRGSYFPWSYLLSAAEYNGGTPRIRIVDKDSLEQNPGGLGIEYLRVESS